MSVPPSLAAAARKHATAFVRIAPAGWMDRGLFGTSRALTRGMGKIAFGVCVTITLVACGEANTGIDRAVESRLTIASGVYGQTTSLDDVGKNAPQYHSMGLSVFDSEDRSNAVASVGSDERGFYQIELPPGDFTICTSFGRCSPLQVMAEQCTRLDYEFGVGPGWSAALSGPCGK